MTFNSNNNSNNNNNNQFYVTARNALWDRGCDSLGKRPNTCLNMTMVSATGGPVSGRRCWCNGDDCNRFDLPATSPPGAFTTDSRWLTTENPCPCPTCWDPSKEDMTVSTVGIEPVLCAQCWCVLFFSHVDHTSVRSAYSDRSLSLSLCHMSVCRDVEHCD